MTTTTSRVTKTRAIKLGFAALATAALTIGGLTPAYAADVQLGPADIAGFENGDESQVGDGYNYDQWHIGSVTNPEIAVGESLNFDGCSVEFLAVPENSELNPDDRAKTVTQLLKGFPIDARPSTTADIRAAIESTSAAFEADSGSVTLQFPFFKFRSDAETGEPVSEYDPWFGTVRNTDGFTDGTAAIGAETELMGSKGGAGTLDELMEFMEYEITAGAENGEDVRFELLGIGMTGSAGTEVQSFGFLGNTYYFGEGDCLPEAPVDPADPETPETPAAPKKPVSVETGF